jgi:hypothetical protein
MAAKKNLTFLQFFCSHKRTVSSPWSVSALWKKSTLGLPSFFGPKVAIFHQSYGFFTERRFFYTNFQIFNKILVLRGGSGYQN